MGDEKEIMFTVSDVASIFSVNEETVRRWIRSGKLRTVINSKKDGYQISDKALREFVAVEKPKYQKLLPFMGLSLTPMAAILPLLGAVPGIDLNEIIKQSVQKQIDSILSKNSADTNERLKASLSEHEGEKLPESSK